ncbi:DHHA1 domain-containing protein [Streptomyces sp. NBC_00335]|uniref:DHHA1 domain-containing protein n=1 Tax=unclassified Streptomyces TaxID=2593676 RepID=UPI002258CA88|nr:MULTISPECIES: DHHA1 domain-containing protein [unclassified Streptomyces]MCX5405972.1 DHHA1 domain-containing protein [Streptomyces sp. NBC_00086]
MADLLIQPPTPFPFPKGAQEAAQQAARETPRETPHTCHDRRLLRELADLLGAQPQDAPAALRTRLALLAEARAEVERLRGAELSSAARVLAGRAQIVPGGLLVVTRVDNTTGRRLRHLASAATGHLSRGMGVVVLCTAYEGRALLVCAVGHQLRARGVDARDVLQEAAAAIGGTPAGRGARSSAAGQWTDELGSALSSARAKASALLRRSVG